MADENLKWDENKRQVSAGVTTDDQDIRQFRTTEEGYLIIRDSNYTPPVVPGAPGYFAGDAGVVNVPAGYRILQIAAHTTFGGSVDFGDGAIPVPAKTQFSAVLEGEWTGPIAVTFIGTDSYFVEVEAT